MIRMSGRESVRRAVFVLAAMGAVSVAAPVAAGQMELAVMQGTVKDDAGKPLEGVTFRMKDLGRGRETTIKSDKEGKFYRRGLQAVEYELVVEKEGYQPINDKIKLTAGTDRRLDFKLVKAAPEGAGDFAKGVEAYNRGDHQAAAQAFEAAVQKAPDLAEVRVNLALAYFRLQRPADAVAQLEKAAALAPDSPRVLFQLGGAYVEMQALDKAAAAFEKGLAKQSDASDPLVLEATTTLGAVYFAKGENDKAVAQFDKALAAKPDNAAAKLGLGKVYFSKGDIAKALELFQQVVASAPGTPEAAQAEAFIKELKKPQDVSREE
jgi:tetratricopeptide (TPR) repeat protein